MQSTQLLLLASSLQLCNAFLYSYTQGELTITVSEVTHVSTVIDGSTYDFNFLAPTVTNTIHSIATDSGDLSLDAANAISSISSYTGTYALSVDTATTFSIYKDKSDNSSSTSDDVTFANTTSFETSYAQNSTTLSSSATFNKSTSSNTTTKPSSNGNSVGAASVLLAGALAVACFL